MTNYTNIRLWYFSNPINVSLCLQGEANEMQRRKNKTNERSAQRYKGVDMFLY